MPKKSTFGNRVTGSLVPSVSANPPSAYLTLSGKSASHESAQETTGSSTTVVCFTLGYDNHANSTVIFAANRVGPQPYTQSRHIAGQFL